MATPRRTKSAPKKVIATRTRFASSSRNSGKKSVKEKGWVFLIFGTLFGYFLSKARATDYDTVIAMFRFKQFQLYGVLLTAVAVVALGLFLLRRSIFKTYSGKPLDWKEPVFDPQRLIGALLFGTGWALTGVCPGTALTQIGEGKWVAFATVIGIFAGVWAYSKYKPAPHNEVC